MIRCSIDTEDDIILACERAADGSVVAKIELPDLAGNSVMMQNIQKIIANKTQAQSFDQFKETRNTETDASFIIEGNGYGGSVITLPPDCIRIVNDDSVLIIIDDTRVLEASLGDIDDPNNDKEYVPESVILPGQKVILGQKTDYNPSVSGDLLVANPQLEPEEHSMLHTDVHNHLAGLLSPDRLMALGIKHDVDYNLFQIIKNDLELTDEQKQNLMEQYSQAGYPAVKDFDELKDLVKGSVNDKGMKDLFEKTITLKFKDLVTSRDENGNLLPNGNIRKINRSLRLPNDGQATFSILEEVYDARDPFVKGDGNKTLDDSEIKSYIEALGKYEYSKVGLYLEQINSFEPSDNLSEDEKAKLTEICGDGGLQGDLLLWTAKEANEQGVDHIQTSQATLTKAGKAEKYVELINKVLPLVEKETDVDIRFLAALRRNFDKKEDFEKSVKTLIESARSSRYVVGSDVMGEELNETEHFGVVLTEVAKYAINEDPNFVIRVHAGENSSLKDNIKQVLELVDSEMPKDEEGNPTKPYPQIRIGHGLEGPEYVKTEDGIELTESGKALVELMQKTGTIVELNLTSNVRLNNLAPQEVTKKLSELMKVYKDQGVGLVFGSDGAKIYGTSIQHEQDFVTTSLGGNKDMIDHAVMTEEKITENVKARDKLFEERQQFVEKANEEKKPEKQEEQQEEEKKFESDKDVSEKLIHNWKDLKDEDRSYVVVAGGSFSTLDRDRQEEELKQGDKDMIQRMVEHVKKAPDKFNLVIGHHATKQEGYLLDLVEQYNSTQEDPDKKINLVMVAPKGVAQEVNYMTSGEEQDIRRMRENARRDGVSQVIEANIQEAAGLYKKFTETIFRDKQFALLAFEGDAPVQNLILEASHSNQEHTIMVSTEDEKAMAEYRALGDKKIMTFSPNDTTSRENDRKSASDVVKEVEEDKSITYSKVQNINGLLNDMVRGRDDNTINNEQQER